MGDALTVATAEQVAEDGTLKTMANVFLSPSEAFRTLSRTRRWLVPILICILMSVAYQAATSHYRMADLRDRIVHDTTLSPEEVARRTGNIDAQRTAGLNYDQIIVGVTYLTAGHVFNVAIVSLLLWSCVKLCHSAATYRQVFSGISFVFLVTVPEKVMLGILTLVKGSVGICLGPAVIMAADRGSSLVFDMLDRLDIFSIWIAVLMAIALPILAGISKRQSVVIVVSMWAVWALSALLPIRLFQIS